MNSIKNFRELQKLTTSILFLFEPVLESQFRCYVKTLTELIPVNVTVWMKTTPLPLINWTRIWLGLLTTGSLKYSFVWWLNTKSLTILVHSLACSLVVVTRQQRFPGFANWPQFKYSKFFFVLKLFCQKAMSTYFLIGYSIKSFGMQCFPKTDTQGNSNKLTVTLKYMK